MRDDQIIACAVLEFGGFSVKYVEAEGGSGAIYV